MGSHADAVRAAVRQALANERALAAADGAGNGNGQIAAGKEHAEDGCKGAEGRGKTEAGGAKRKRKRRDGGGVDANWKKLQKVVGGVRGGRGGRGGVGSGKVEVGGVGAGGAKELDEVKVSAFMKRRVAETEEVSKVVALDCEMVGVGEGGREDALGRVSVVNYAGDVLYDRFVKVRDTVTDYRTQWSGIRAEDVSVESKGAVELWEAQKRVGELVKGRVVVGHALGNDWKVLRLKHPRWKVRDTSLWYGKVWRRNRGRRGAKGPALREVVTKVLGVDAFQGGEHDSCEDARAALMLYKKNRVEWEREVRERGKARGGARGPKRTGS